MNISSGSQASLRTFSLDIESGSVICSPGEARGFCVVGSVSSVLSWGTDTLLRLLLVLSVLSVLLLTLWVPLLSLTQFFDRAREMEFFKSIIQIPDLPDVSTSMFPPEEILRSKSFQTSAKEFTQKNIRKVLLVKVLRNGVAIKAQRDTFKMCFYHQHY